MAMYFFPLHSMTNDKTPAAHLSGQFNAEVSAPAQTCHCCPVGRKEKLEGFVTCGCSCHNDQTGRDIRIFHTKEGGSLIAEKPFPGASAYMAGTIQGDSEDLHGACVGDLFLVMRDTPDNRHLLSELIKRP